MPSSIVYNPRIHRDLWHNDNPFVLVNTVDGENVAVAVIVSTIDTSLLTKNKENFGRTVAGGSHWKRLITTVTSRA